jgi:hypothetical protein
VNIIAIAQGSSECNLSFVVSRDNMKTALAITHREFQLDTLNSPALPVAAPSGGPSAWYAESLRVGVDAD